MVPLHFKMSHDDNRLNLVSLGAPLTNAERDVFYDKKRDTYTLTDLRLIGFIRRNLTAVAPVESFPPAPQLQTQLDPNFQDETAIPIFKLLASHKPSTALYREIQDEALER
jgi:hypothetical protein